MEERLPKKEVNKSTDAVGNHGLKRRSMSAKGTDSDGDHVKVYAGFVEKAYRIVFPYGASRANFDPNRVVTHMTILENGVVENPPKRLYIGGVFGATDRDELRSQTEKELRKMLKARKEEAKATACKEGDKEGLVAALMGLERETELDSRALISFPFLQSVPEKAASKHILLKPNSDFVTKRDNGSFAVGHCWPIKYNEEFRKQFKVSERNWDFSKFSPRKAHEFRQCMARLFGDLGNAKLLYCVKETNNPMKVLLGTTEQLIDFLRVRPSLQAEMNILKLHPDGFITKVITKGKTDSEKQFRLKLDGQPQVIYVKKGFETMASCKPLHLFNKDCEFPDEPIECPPEIEIDTEDVGKAPPKAPPTVAASKLAA
jgi:hypothetical protein